MDSSLIIKISDIIDFFSDLIFYMLGSLRPEFKEGRSRVP
jgi:hypothetical protein